MIRLFCELNGLIFDEMIDMLYNVHFILPGLVGVRTTYVLETVVDYPVRWEKCVAL